MRITDGSDPCGAQSANPTPSKDSRGEPPSTEARARIPSFHPHSIGGPRFSSKAISLEGDKANTSALVTPKERDSALPGRVQKSSTGLPSHEALYTTSGLPGTKRADQMVP